MPILSRSLANEIQASACRSAAIAQSTRTRGWAATLALRRGGRASPNDQWSVHRWRPKVTGLAPASPLLGRAVKDFSASRSRQPSHRAPEGGARCDRVSPPAARHLRATRDRAPAQRRDAERHAALTPASPSDRRRACDSAQARGMDALALAMSANRGIPPCDESPRLHAPRPRQCHRAAPPCPAVPSMRARWLLD
jgi:hypothetical protein